MADSALAEAVRPAGSDEAANSPATANTFPELIRAAAAAFGDDPAVVLNAETIPDDSITFAGLERRSAELARGLLARGVGKGSRIGFIHGNGPSFAVTLAAIARIGAVAVPISTLIKANELVRVLRQSDVSGLIVQRHLLRNDYARRLADALPALRTVTDPDLRLPETPYLRWIVSTGAELPPGIRDIAWLTDAAGSVSETMLQAVEAEVHTTDQMVEIYTSGSMALPKGVKHNHGPVVFRARYLAKMINAQRGKPLIAFMPMFWVGGLTLSLLPALVVGGVSTCTESTSTNSRMSMGSVLPEEDLKLLGEKQSGPYWGLGMSETLGPYSYGDDFRAPGYPVCAPMDHWADRYEVRVVDESNRPVGEGEIGEIQVRGYALTSGLHKIERDGYFTDDGFYHTGDLGLVEGSRVHFVGRNGDMIKTGGSNVSPAEVEMEMQAMEGIHSAYVVGLPDAERGQIVVAAVVPRDGAKLDYAQVQAQLRQRLSSFKVPREYVEITREEVPMLPTNKVHRRQIETLVAERLGRAAR